MRHMDKIIVFTDGSSRGNPGPGGYGAIVVDTKDKVTELGGREDKTTNNRMELSAAKEALAFIESRKIEGNIEINTDSAYLLQGVTGWMYGWEKNGWKTKTGEDVLNQDIWKELGGLVFRLKQKREIEWKKVSGHTGHRGNERADEIATAAADQKQQILFIGNLTDYETMLGGSLFEGTDEELVAKKKSKSRTAGPAYSYVSMIGGLIEVHKTWPECETRVKGKPSARYKKVFSADEERSLIEEWTASNLKHK
jgi:ribonuclease HI